jgi:N-acetylglutamate synthase-like GNAT family acetyltransferase
MTDRAMPYLVRPLAPADALACDAIILGLPDFFGHEGGRAECAEAVRTQPGWVVEQDREVIGFATWQQRTPVSAEVTWMAVRRDRRHGGIGTAIIERLVAGLRDAGYALAFAMTSAAHKDPTIPDTYTETRRFWTSRGFLPLTVLDIWDTDLALVLVRPLTNLPSSASAPPGLPATRT